MTQVIPNLTKDEINEQAWAGMDGGTAFRLIARHGANGGNVAQLMEAWRAANSPATKAATPAPVPAEHLPTKEHIRELAQEALDQIMEQAQVFADAWAAAGIPFESSDSTSESAMAKDELRAMVQFLADLVASTVRPALSLAPAPEALAVERDEQMGRDYIPLPGGWELQTKGKGSTLRLMDKKAGERHPLPLPDFIVEFIERMAREVNAASQAPAVAQAGKPVAWTLRETLDRAETTTTGYLWFTDPQNSAWVPLYTGPVQAPAPAPASPGDVSDLDPMTRAALRAWKAGRSKPPAQSIDKEQP